MAMGRKGIPPFSRITEGFPVSKDRNPYQESEVLSSWSGAGSAETSEYPAGYRMTRTVSFERYRPPAKASPVVSVVPESTEKFVQENEMEITPNLPVGVVWVIAVPEKFPTDICREVADEACAAELCMRFSIWGRYMESSVAAYCSNAAVSLSVERGVRYSTFQSAVPLSWSCIV
jgi:hypothetical protein